MGGRKSPKPVPKKKQTAIVEEKPEQGLFSKYKDLFWPIAGFVLAGLGLPIAIEQYPEVFKDNAWILPISICVIVACLVAPLAVHHRLKEYFGWLKAVPHIGKILAVLIPAFLVGALWVGAQSIFRFHQKHLIARLQKNSPDKPEAAQESCAPDVGHVGYMTSWGLFDPQGGRVAAIKNFKLLKVVANGKILLPCTDKYKVAAVAFHFLGLGDYEDQTNLQKSFTHDIGNDESVDILIPLDETFRSEMRHHAVGTSYVLLLIPNGVDMNAFSSIRQASALGARVIQNSSGSP